MQEDRHAGWGALDSEGHEAIAERLLPIDVKDASTCGVAAMPQPAFFAQAELCPGIDEDINAIDAKRRRIQNGLLHLRMDRGKATATFVKVVSHLPEDAHGDRRMRRCARVWCRSRETCGKLEPVVAAITSTFVFSLAGRIPAGKDGPVCRTAELATAPHDPHARPVQLLLVDTAVGCAGLAA